MKCLLLTVALLMCVGCIKKPARQSAPTAPSLPCEKTGNGDCVQYVALSAKVTLCNPPVTDTPECRAKLLQWERKKQAKLLIEILQSDFPNIVGFNKNERDHEAELELWLAKHRYD